METIALTIKEFCEQYRVGRTKAYALIASSELERKKLGRKSLITAASAKAWFACLPNGDVAKAEKSLSISAVGERQSSASNSKRNTHAYRLLNRKGR
jgi:excisionase family DNA binding protein